MVVSADRNKILPMLIAVGICIVVIVPRSTVVLLILSLLGLLFLGLSVRREKLNTIVLCGVVVLAAWPLVSCIWSPNSASEWFAALKVAVLIISGFSICRYASPSAFSELGEGENIWAVAGYIGGVSVIAIAMIYAYITGKSLWGAYFSDPLTTLNSNAVVLALMLAPIMSLLSRSSIRVRAGLVGAVMVLLFTLSSMAAIVAVLAGAATFFVRKFFGQCGGIAIALLAVMFVLSVPYAVKMSGAAQFTQPQVMNDSSSALPYSMRHRLAMWSFAVEKIDEKPWLGWGFGSSRHIPQEDRRLAPNMEIMPLHPHNLALQTRLELGLPGVLILAALVFTVFYRLATFTDDPWKSGIAMAAASGWLFVANVSYGMWQSWWIALAFLLAVLMKISFYVQPTKREIRD